MYHDIELYTENVTKNQYNSLNTFCGTVFEVLLLPAYFCHPFIFAVGLFCYFLPLSPFLCSPALSLLFTFPSSIQSNTAPTHASPNLHPEVRRFHIVLIESPPYFSTFFVYFHSDWPLFISLFFISQSNNKNCNSLS